MDSSNLFPIPNYDVAAFLGGEKGNNVGGGYMDACGRYIMPMDDVMVEYMSDEEVVCCVEGNIMDITPYGVNVTFQPDFVMRFKQEYKLVKPEQIIRLPKYPLRKQVVAYFQAINFETIYHHDPEINGVPFSEHLYP